MARGRSRSAPLTETVDQAEEIAAAGCKEIVLSGVNVGLYGREHGASLLELIMRLDEVAGVDRFRISSIEPNLLTDEIVDFVAASERFMPHFHVPLQSGDNRVLGTMRRRYRREAYADRVDYILDRMPHACIGADVIVGSPGESTDAFESTRDFIVDLPLAYLHVFTYSERPDTTAVQNVIDGTSDSVPRATRRERSRTLRLLSDRMRSTFYASQAGKERNVLWESANSDGSMYGYTDNYVRVQTEFDEQRTGSVELVTLGQETLNGCVNVADATIALPIIQQMQ